MRMKWRALGWFSHGKVRGAVESRARIEGNGGSASHPQRRLPLAKRHGETGMFYCLSVRLAHKPETVVSEFCELDETDGFCLDPPGTWPGTWEDEGDPAVNPSRHDKESHNRRVLWFRCRRILYLSRPVH